MEGVAVGVGHAGQRHAGEADVVGLGSASTRTSLNRPSCVTRRTRRASPPCQPSTLAPEGRHRASLIDSGSFPVHSSVTTAVRAVTPWWQSSVLANSSGECETPVGLRTKSIALGTPVRREDARVVPGARAEQRRVGEYAAQPLHESRVEGRGRGPRLLGGRRRRAPRRRPDVLDRARTASSLGAAGVEPGRDVARDGVDAARAARRTLPTVATHPGPTAYDRGGVDDVGEAEHGVAAVLDAGGAGVVGLAGDVDAPAAVRPDVGADGDGAGRVGEVVAAVGASARALPCSTCSSTKRPMRRTASSSRPRVSGSRPAPRHASAIETPSASVSARARSASRAPVMMREPAQATPKRAPSSSTKLTTPSGTSGSTPRLAQRVDGREGADDPERAVEGAAVGHGVEVRADDDARASCRGHPTSAHWLPARSSTRSSPRAAHSPANHSRRSWSVAGPGVAAVAARRRRRARRARGRPTSGRSSSSRRSPLLASAGLPDVRAGN